MEHTIHLAAGDFIKVIGPKSKSWTKNHTASVEDSDEEVDWNQLELLPDEQVVDDETEFTAGDTLGKALALVNQVSFVLPLATFHDFSCH